MMKRMVVGVPKSPPPAVVRPCNPAAVFTSNNDPIEYAIAGAVQAGTGVLIRCADETPLVIPEGMTWDISVVTEGEVGIESVTEAGIVGGFNITFESPLSPGIALIVFRGMLGAQLVIGPLVVAEVVEEAP